MLRCFCHRVLLPITLFFFLASYTCPFDAEAWPTTEEAADNDVAQSRQETLAAEGTAPTETDAWTRREYVIGTTARIPVIKGVALSFKLGILKIAELLWPPKELKIGLVRMKKVAESSAETECHQRANLDSPEGNPSTH